MSLLYECENDLNRYEVLRDNINSIMSELSLAIENTASVSDEVKSKYLINDNYTPIVSRCEKLKDALETVYNNLSNKIVPAIDSSISELEYTIELERERLEKERLEKERLAKEQLNNEQGIV